MILEGKETIQIWGSTIPGNTGKSKSDVMNIDKTLTMDDVFDKYPGIWDKSTPELGDMRGNDYMVWKQEIQEGYAEETYSDEPFIVPYLSEGSDRCVILCPGGAYLNKSMDSEGSEVAQVLNQNGISAFVLWYRTYPYRAPYMYLDCQRAVRYVRYHAAEFGIDPNKIAITGFSAGGNLCGVETLCFGDAPVDIDGYTMDEVDAVSGKANALGLIYPAVAMEEDKIIAAIGGRDVYQDPVARHEFAMKYDMISNVAGAPPMFLCACVDDDVVPAFHLMELMSACRKHELSCELHMFPYGGHGFGACIPRWTGPFPPADYSAVDQWLGLYVRWLKNTLR